MSVSMDAIKAIMFGHAIGDALGTVEFSPREELSVNPVAGRRGFGCMACLRVLGLMIRV